MEINEGWHSCDLHWGSGSATDPRKYGPKSGWGKGGHTHTQKKKKRKGKTFKDGHLWKDKRNNFLLDASQRLPANWVDWILYLCFSFSKGRSQPTQAEQALPNLGSHSADLELCPIQIYVISGSDFICSETWFPQLGSEATVISSRNRCKDKQSCRMKSSWSSGKVELHGKLAGSVCGSSQGDFPSPQVEKGRLSPVYTQEYIPSWVQILAPPIFKTLNPLSLISSSVKSSTYLRLFWGWKKILCIKHGTWPLTCA